MFLNNFIERGAKLDDQGIEVSAKLHSPATHNMSGFIECSRSGAFQEPVGTYRVGVVLEVYLTVLFTDNAIEVK